VTTSETGIALIKHCEGFSAKAYPDVGKWSIGYGHRGDDVHEGMLITEAEAEVFLKRDLERTEAAVTRVVKVTLSQNKFDALVSFSYNVGEANLAKSTMLVYINCGKFDRAVAEFPKWDHVAGKVDAGLLARRQLEANLFKEA
jgi:lysozyme